METTKVYVAKTDGFLNDEVFMRCYNASTHERKEKVDRLMLKKDKILALAAEELLRFALKKEGIDEFEVEYNEHKKPYLKGYSDVFFNISHCENMVMCAVSPNEVGCDIEKIKEPKMDVAKRFFSKNEVEYIDKKSSDEEKADAFYRVWTLKESFLKAKGTGLKIPLYSFEVISGEKAVSPDGDFNFSEFCIGRYRCAVCHMTDEAEWKTVDETWIAEK